MSIFDFRARPNTREYMAMWMGGDKEHFWRRLGRDNPGVVDSVSDFILELDRVGIDLALFTGRQLGPPDTLREGITNDYVAAVVAEFSDRLLGVAGVDVSEPLTAVDEAVRSIRELRLLGVSIDPHLVGVFPDDRSCYPLYEEVMSLGVPIFLTMGPLSGRFGDPWCVDRVADDFPDLTIVCSHGCWPEVHKYLGLACRHENVYLEASVCTFMPGTRPFLEMAANRLQDQVVYASAFPFDSLEAVEKFRAVGWTDEVWNKLTYSNAMRILGLD